MARMMRDRAERRRAEREMDDVQSSPFVQDETLEALDASIRRKLDLGEALSPEERMFFATMPASREMTPAEVQRLGDREGAPQ